MVLSDQYQTLLLELYVSTNSFSIGFGNGIHQLYNYGIITAAKFSLKNGISTNYQMVQPILQLL